MGLTFIPQHDSTDCGAACLAMILYSYGKTASIAAIRELASTDLNGTTFQGMIKAAESLGLTAKGVKGTPELFDHPLPLPMVFHVFLRQSGQYHFVVVYKIGKARIWIADPAKGKYRIKKETLLEDWTGGVIIFSLNGEGSKMKRISTPLLRFVPLMKPYAFLFGQIFFISFLLFWCALGQFFYFRYLVDHIIPAGLGVTLHVVSLGIVGLTFLQMTMAGLREYVLNHIGCRIDLSILLTYFRHILHLPMDFFDKRKVGEILTRMDDARQIRQILSGTALSSIMDSLLVLGVGTFLFFQSPILAAIALATVPLSVLVVFVFHPLFREGTKESMILNGMSNSHMVESLSGIFTLKTLNHELRSFWIGERKMLASLHSQFRLTNMGILQNMLLGLIEAVGRIVLLWQGAVLILRGELSLGQLISFQALVGYFIGPLKSLLTLQPALQGAQEAARRIGELLDLNPEPRDSNKLYLGHEIACPIEVRELVFHFTPRRPTLKNISFTIEKGQRIGIVGSSGSGKSTLIKLLLGFYFPTSGSITYNRGDTRDLSPSVIRKAVGYIPQEIRLFSGTLHDNLVMYNPDCSVADVFDACIKAGLLEFITELPDRFLTWVGEQGSSLSGGERQRIAIARALIGRPEILLFDEATSALDTLTESKIQRTIEELNVQGITTISVAHRLSSIVNCHRIYLLENGEIQESGNHEELFSRKGAYYRLWNEQRVSL